MKHAPKHATRAQAPEDTPESAKLALFEEVYHRGLPRVMRTLRAMGVYRLQDREDLAQNIFLAIFRKLDPEAPPENPEAWVARFAFFFVLNHRRRALHHREKLTPEIEQVMMDNSLNPEEKAAEKERDHVLAMALEKLSEERRLVLIMADVQGFSINEIAEALEVPVSTAYDRLTRARRDFAQAVQRLNPEKRKAMGFAVVAGMSLTEGDLDVFFAELRRIYAAEPLDGVRDRVWARIQQNLRALDAMPQAPRSGLRRKSTSHSLADGIARKKAASLAVGSFVAGVIAKTLFDLLWPTLPTPWAHAALTLASENAPSPPPSLSIPITAPPSSSPPPIIAQAPSPSASAPPALPSATPTSRATTAASSPREREAAIIAHARQALFSGQPALALRITQDHARRYPMGDMRDERDALAIRAHAALGHREQAADALTRFRTLYPGSPHLRALTEIAKDAPAKR